MDDWNRGLRLTASGHAEGSWNRPQAGLSQGWQGRRIRQQVAGRHKRATPAGSRVAGRSQKKVTLAGSDEYLGLQ